MNERRCIVRRARMNDVKAIHQLLCSWAAKEMLLARSLSHLYNHVRDFFVLCLIDEQAETVVGCCALSIVWEDLAELCSLAVRPDLLRRGHGRRLVEAVVADAQEIGLAKLFALTYQEAFFKRMNFELVGKETLPQKVWTDCIHCPKFPDCDEIAMMRTL